MKDTVIDATNMARDKDVYEQAKEIGKRYARTAKGSALARECARRTLAKQRVDEQAVFNAMPVASATQGFTDGFFDEVTAEVKRILGVG